MELRELGRTGEKASAIGMGTWKIGDYATQAEKAEQVRALAKGIELGMNFIDTAEVYGEGRSELLVAEVIRGHRDSALIATKVRPSNLHREYLIRACEGSLKRLGVDCIDLYQVHWPNPKIPIAETMAAMEELVRKGRIRFIGVSNFSVAQTEEARQALARSEVVSNQVEYSITQRSPEADVLPYCRREGLSLIAYTPISRGRLREEDFPPGLPAKYGMTPAQLALSWVTKDESVLAIPKSGRADHMVENAASLSPRLTPEEYDLIGRAHPTS